VEKIPSWLPGMHFKKMSEKWSKHLQDITDIPFQLVKEQIVSKAAMYDGTGLFVQSLYHIQMAGTALPSFTSAIMADKNLSPEDEQAIKLAAMVINFAGADTVSSCALIIAPSAGYAFLIYQTSATITGFFLAMALYPAVFKKAQKEIDAVVGTQRIPSISDKVDLPYTTALIRELFRWTVVVPNGSCKPILLLAIYTKTYSTQKGVPHKTSQDDVHAGYLIPKGSIILSNI
jgi:hypothetical protein